MESENPSVIYAGSLEPVQEADPIEEQSVLIPEAKKEIPLEDQVALPEGVFTIRNLDTGEEIDLRDMHKEHFSETFSRVLEIQSIQKASEQLHQIRQKNNMLWQAAHENNYQQVRRLINWQKGEDTIAQVNSRGLHDWTALHIATNEGFYEVCQVLIFEGEMIDIEAKTSTGKTPLHLACIAGHMQIVMLLVEEGANLDCVDYALQTPLHFACMHGHLQVVQWLLDSGCSLNMIDSMHKHPIDLAGSFEIVQIIQKYCEENNVQIYTQGYSRTPFYNILLKNSRTDQINQFLINKPKKVKTRADLRKLLEDSKTFAISQRQTLTKSMEEAIIEPVKPVNAIDFEAVFELGKGSFGRVFLMRKQGTQDMYAVKVLDKDKVFTNNLIRYAFTERNILKRINHPFIVKLNYAFQTPKKLALVMDFYSGGDFGKILCIQKRLTEEMAKIYISEIALAIGELHTHGIVFRDLKPENIVLDSQGHAHLTDFGLSKEGIYHGMMSRSFCGSVAYLPPEMLRRKGHDKSVDWYLLGVLSYEMLVGKPPYYSSNRERLYYNIQKARLTFPKHVSPEAQSFIRSLIDRVPKRRIGYGADDVEEVKRHEFLSDINWDMVINKQYTPHQPVIPRRQHKHIPLEEAFGELEVEIPERKIEGWSVMEV